LFGVKMEFLLSRITERQPLANRLQRLYQDRLAQGCDVMDRVTPLLCFTLVCNVTILCGCSGSRSGVTQVDLNAGPRPTLIGTEMVVRAPGDPASATAGVSSIGEVAPVAEADPSAPTAEPPHSEMDTVVADAATTGNAGVTQVEFLDEDAAAEAAATTADEWSIVPPALDSADGEPRDAIEAADSTEQMPLPLTVPEGDLQALPAESDAPWQPENGNALVLDEVITSIYGTFPMLESALFERNIASGERLSATGEFDLKLKAATENDVLGFYQNYRQSVGFMRPNYNGSEFFGGYRVGNGFFEPWYLERETNEGGEFKFGFNTPLARDREIDQRRADLWRANVNRQIVEPDIQAQLIGFVLEGSYAYWDWVAAGEKYQIARDVLDIALERNDRIRRQVREDLVPEFDQVDNERLIRERQAKLADSERKLRQTAVKLSIYYRDINGNPVLVPADYLPGFPLLEEVSAEQLAVDADLALQTRPEIAYYELLRRKLNIDMSEARNDLRPSLDAVMSASQDFGQPTSSKNDKGEFELEAGLYFDVPLQRRKARGKIQQVDAKMAQLTAKRRFVEDKIVADVRLAYAGLTAAYEQALRAEEAVELAQDVAIREARRQAEGLSDMLKVNLREQYAVEAAEKAVDAKLIYFKARADYRAAMGQDRLP
jgi:outer membrane protein TolC